MKIGTYRNASQAKKLLDGINAALGEDYALLIDKSSHHSPDPDLSLLHFSRLTETLTELPDAKKIAHSLHDPDVLEPLTVLMGSSAYLSQLLIRAPERIAQLFNSSYLKTPKPLEVMSTELESLCVGCDARSGMLNILRKFRSGEMLRIVMRDLMGWGGLEEIMVEISDLASVTVERAYVFSRDEIAAGWGEPYEEEPGVDGRFVVMGMGKLGGEELNYSSDIDIIYIYGSDHGGFRAPEGGESSDKTLSDFWAKVAENVTGLISEVTEDGLVFRVDLRLRPAGASGAVAHSIDGAVEYYQTWGRTWERSALLKARPVAGDIELGEEFLKQLEPWLHRRYLDFGLLDEIKDMKSQINVRAERMARSTWDVKLGRGGIREIEFFVQALQLIHGGKTKSIRCRNTLEALGRLEKEGFISDEDKAELSAAYKFFRRLEHRIQFHEFQQTQRMPNNPEAMARLSGMMGYGEAGGEKLHRFTGDLEDHRARVEERYRALLVDQKDVDDEPLIEEALLIASGQLSEEEAKSWLEKHDFADPNAAFKALERLRDGPRRLAYLSDATRRRWKEIAPLLIQEVAAAPDPDMAITHLERFLAGVGARATTLALLRQYPQTAKFLVNLFGTSEFLSEFFISRPDLLDHMVGPHKLAHSIDPLAMAEYIQRLLKETADLEERLDELRRFVHEFMLQIGLEDLAGAVDHHVTSKRLSELAEATLKAAHTIALDELKKRMGEGVFHLGDEKVEGGLAVLGMGKLGGAELSYGSDLDVIFVYWPAGAENDRGFSSQEYFVKLAQRIISAITLETAQGRCYSMDTRLRPSGRSGSLVTSLESFERYHRESSAAWERQALIRMRPVAGDMEIGRKAMLAVEPFVYDRPLTEDDVAEIRRIRQRMVDERTPGGDRIDIKLDPGGLADAEFTLQVLQLMHGRDIPGLRVQYTDKAIEALAPIMDEADRINLLAGWEFLRGLSMRLRITRAPESPIIDMTGRRAAIIAKMIGYKHEDDDCGARLVDDIRNHMRIIRGIYEKYVRVGSG